MLTGFEILLIIGMLIYLFASNYKSPKKRWAEYEEKYYKRQEEEEDD